MTSDEFFQKAREFVEAIPADIAPELRDPVARVTLFGLWLQHVSERPKQTAIAHNTVWSKYEEAFARGGVTAPSFKQVNALKRYHQNGFLSDEELENAEPTKKGCSALIAQATQRRAAHLAGNPGAKPPETF